MKYLFIATCLAALLLPAIAKAGDLVCKVPTNCVKPIGSKFSSGGGKTAVQYIQVDCYDAKGHMVSYLDEIPSLAGLFGFGRFTLPNKIVYLPSRASKMSCGG